MSPNILRIAAGAACVSAFTSASADTIHVIDDTFINLSQPTSNKGNSLELTISNASGERRGFALFDVSTLPASLASAQIESATLRFWVKSVNGAGGTLALYLVNGPWFEETLV